MDNVHVFLSCSFLFLVPFWNPYYADYNICLLYLNGFADSGVWTKVASVGDGPCARFSVSGACLDPQKQGVLVFFGGCNRSLEALDDIYYFHTG